MIDPIPYAVPVFLLAILFEAIWTRIRRRHEYRFNDTITCLSTSIMSSLAGASGAGVIVYCYVLIYEHVHLFDMRVFNTSLQILCWIALILLQDMCYYWFHRAAHRINFLWASHVTHHSSEEYNLAVALRQSTFQQFFSWPVYLPLALIGFPPEWLAFTISINLIYQFWFHTREVDRLPRWVEAIFNTPSHHRVHHGTNPQYLDKNYGGIFIVWDRLFGTFEPEVEEVRYGLTVPLASYNPVWANIHYYWYLAERSLDAPDLMQAVHLWVAPPDWKPEWLQNMATVASTE